MFDFTNIVQGVANMVGGSQAVDALSAGNALNALSDAGFDLQSLQDLPVDDVFAALSSAGLDASQLTDGQIGELLGLLGSTGGEQ